MYTCVWCGAGQVIKDAQDLKFQKQEVSKRNVFKGQNRVFTDTSQVKFTFFYSSQAAQDQTCQHCSNAAVLHAQGAQFSHHKNLSCKNQHVQHE